MCFRGKERQGYKVECTTMAGRLLCNKQALSDKGQHGRGGEAGLNGSPTSSSNTWHLQVLIVVSEAGLWSGFTNSSMY